MSTFGVSGKPSYRSNNAFGFLICALSLTATEFYIEPYITEQNCALCTIIRLILVVMAGLFLISFLLNRSMIFQRLAAAIHLLLITSGIITSVRSLFADPGDLSPACNLSSASLFEQGSINALWTTLDNAANCPYPAWQIYQLNVAHLSLILMLIMLVVVWKILIKKQQRNLFF